MQQEEEKFEVEYRPLKKLVIMESVEMPQKELFERLITQIKLTGQPVALNWVEGILFVAVPVDSQSDLIIKEILRGNTYWANIFYAKMPSYQPIVKIGGVEIPIINQSRSARMRLVAQWIKKRSENMLENGK